MKIATRPNYTLLIRADASDGIGIGHVMRCLALGQAWQDLGGSVVFACSQLAQSLRKRIQNEGMQLKTISSPIGSHDDALETLAIAKDINASALAFDGYDFDQAYQDTIVKFNGPTLMLDDYGQIHRYATSLVLNQNLGANESLYKNRDENTQVLLGPQYALLRREFLSQKTSPRSRNGEIRNVLVTLGGSDPTNSLQTIIKAIIASDRQTLKFRVVAGPLNKHLGDLTDAAESFNNIELVQSVDNMAAEYEWADLAIAAAGSSNWEMCCFNLPRIVVQTASNQSLILQQLTQLGVATSLGASADLTAESIQQKLGYFCDNPNNFQQSISACQQLNKNVAVENVASLLWPKLNIRLAEQRDARQYFEWVNDPAVRRNSINTHEITWQDHLSWYQSKLDSNDAALFIAELNGRAVGQIRFEKNGTSHNEIDISVDANHRGRNLAIAIAELAIKRMADRGETSFSALVKPENTASTKTFHRLGFIQKQESNSSLLYFQLRLP